jgi:hypothetical protein
MHPLKNFSGLLRCIICDINRFEEMVTGIALDDHISDQRPEFEVIAWSGSERISQVYASIENHHMYKIRPVSPHRPT